MTPVNITTRADLHLLLHYVLQYFLIITTGHGVLFSEYCRPGVFFSPANAGKTGSQGRLLPVKPIRCPQIAHVPGPVSREATGLSQSTAVVNYEDMQHIELYPKVLVPENRNHREPTVI